MSTFTIIFISALVGFIIRPYVDALFLILENAWRKYEAQKDKIESVYPQEADLPKRLVTKSEFEEVLNYYLPNLWEMDFEYIDNFLHLTIKFKQPLLTKRIKLLQEYISEYKIVGVVVRYELI
jgi:hypothetical protein